nr:hypothetical protein [Tanacetum cinerariifolium]
QTFLRKFNRYSFFKTPKVLLLAWDRVFKIKDAFGNKKYKPEDIQELIRKLFNDVQSIHEELAEYINTPIIKSNVEDLVPIPSEFDGIYDVTCDLPFCDNSPPLDVLKDQFEDFSASNDDCTLSDDDSFEDIDYVEASPPDSKLVSLEETFSNHTEEPSSGSTTTHADHSLLEYDSFIFKIEPDQGELTSVVMEDILGEHRVHVPNILPTHPTLYLDSNFTPSDDSLGSDLEVSFPSRTKNKIFDPGIFFEVQSKIFYHGIHFIFHLSVILFV